MSRNNRKMESTVVHTIKMLTLMYEQGENSGPTKSFTSRTEMAPSMTYMKLNANRQCSWDVHVLMNKSLSGPSYSI